MSAAEGRVCSSRESSTDCRKAGAYGVSSAEAGYLVTIGRLFVRGRLSRRLRANCEQLLTQNRRI